MGDTCIDLRGDLGMEEAEQLAKISFFKIYSGMTFSDMELWRGVDGDWHAFFKGVEVEEE